MRSSALPLLLALAVSQPSLLAQTRAPRSLLEVLRKDPDPRSIRDPALRRQITATGRPWLVRERRSGIELVLVPAGSYARGAPAQDGIAQDRERPRHGVRISKPFYLGRYEVSNAELRRWPGAGARKLPQSQKATQGLDAARQPAVYVTWNEAHAFCAAFGMRLPREAEWEYAARAGGAETYFWGRDPLLAPAYANGYDALARLELGVKKPAFPAADPFLKTAPVGSMRANGLGLHDMLGNAAEWCGDWLDLQGYRKHPAALWGDPRGPKIGTFRVVRGGSWLHGPQMCRVTARSGFEPKDRVDLVGFRVLLELKMP